MNAEHWPADFPRILIRLFDFLFRRFGRRKQRYKSPMYTGPIKSLLAKSWTHFFAFTNGKYKGRPGEFLKITVEEVGEKEYKGLVLATKELIHKDFLEWVRSN